MKKKVISAALAAVLALSLPVGAFAEEEDESLLSEMAGELDTAQELDGEEPEEEPEEKEIEELLTENEAEELSPENMQEEALSDEAFTESVPVLSTEEEEEREALLTLYFEVLWNGFQTVTPEELKAATSEDVFEIAVRREESVSCGRLTLTSPERSAACFTEDGCTLTETWKDGEETVSLQHRIVFTETEEGLILSADETGDEEDLSDTIEGETVSVQGENYLTDHPNTYQNTGNQAVDIASIALTQYGYAAQPIDHTKYNYWYYGNADMEAPWCAIFISWCADQAGISTSILQKNAIASWYSLHNMSSNSFGTAYAYDFGTTKAQPGDIIYVDNDGDGYSNHVGLVYKVDDDYIYSIEGNYSNQVSKVLYSAASGERTAYAGSRIVFIARPAYTGSEISASVADPNPDTDPVPVSTPDPTPNADPEPEPSEIEEDNGQIYAGTYKALNMDVNLNIRQEPNTSCSVLGKIPAGGKTVKVLFATGLGDDDWAYGTYNNISGYISMEFLEPVSVPGLKPGKTEWTTVTCRRNGLSIAWKSVSGATSYKLYRKEGEGKWSLLTEVTGPGYYDTSVLSGHTYSYAVKAVSSFGLGNSGPAASGHYLAGTQITSVQNNAGAVTVSWEAVSGASGYYLYRKDGVNGTWHFIAGLKTKTSYKDTDVENGKVYYYAVKTFDSEGASASCAAVNTVYLKNVFVRSLTNAQPGTMELVTSVNEKASGYEIQYSVLGDFTDADTLISDQTSVHVEGLTRWTTYSVRVRAFITVAGYTFKSAWSAPKSIRMTQ